MKIMLQPHNPEWPRQADLLIEDLKSILTGNIARIEHVGSTAVPGLSAKPKLHIDIELAAGASLEDLRDRLRDVGYTDLGFLHRAGEVQMTRSAGERFNARQGSQDRQIMAHRICLAPAGFPAMNHRRAFRDALRQEAGLAREYETLKNRLSDEAGHPPDWDRYNAGNTAFVERVFEEMTGLEF